MANAFETNLWFDCRSLFLCNTLAYLYAVHEEFIFRLSGGILNRNLKKKIEGIRKIHGDVLGRILDGIGEEFLDLALV